MWCRRNKGLAALGALLIASLIAGTGFSLAFAVRANTSAGLANQEAIRANVQAEEAGRQRDWSERLRYIAEINLAQRDWDAGNAELARSRLADVAPERTGAGDVRGWEWFYLDSAFRTELREFRIDDDQTWSVAFAPDGRILGVGRREWGSAALGRGLRTRNRQAPWTSRSHLVTDVFARWPYCGVGGRRRNRSALGCILQERNRHASGPSRLGPGGCILAGRPVARLCRNRLRGAALGRDVTQGNRKVSDKPVNSPAP